MEFRTEMAVVGPYPESLDLLGHTSDDDLVRYAAPASYPAMDPEAWREDDPEHDLLAAHVRAELEWALNVVNFRSVDDRSSLRITHRHVLRVHGRPLALAVSVVAVDEDYDADQAEALILTSPAVLLNSMGSLLVAPLASQPSGPSIRATDQALLSGLDQALLSGLINDAMVEIHQSDHIGYTAPWADVVQFRQGPWRVADRHTRTDVF